MEFRSKSEFLSRRNALATGAAMAITGCGSTAAPRTGPVDAPPRTPGGGGTLREIAGLAEARIAPAIAAEGIPGAAFIAFDHSGVVEQRFWGLADREAGLPVGADTRWPIASITKALTAVSALTLVEKRRLDLDADIRTHLRSIQPPSFAGPPLTLRHLLSHTGGLDEVPGRMWDIRTPMPRVAEFLKGGKLVRIRQAGRLTAYSSYGIAVTSVLVEDASGKSYEDYAAESLFVPLGMQSARFMREARDAQGVAAGYAVEDGRAARTEHEFYVTTGASSAVCTIGDMARFGAMLLARGAVGERRVLLQRTVAEMFRQQATVHPRVPGWGLGVQLDVVGGRAIAEHGGDIGGFASLLTLLPELGVGFFTIHHGEGGNLRYRARDAILAILAPATPGAPSPDPAAVRRLGEYAGRYRSTLECFSCTGDPGENAFRAVAADGTLQLWGQTWVPAGDDFFLRDDALRGLGFLRENGRVYAVTGGSWRVAVKID